MIVDLTDKAVRALHDIILAEEDDLSKDSAVRVAVKGGGCSGFQYELTLDRDAPTDKDEVFITKSTLMYVDRASIPYLEGIVIDYHEDIMSRGFVFNNPQAKATCGCGKSFGV